MKHKILTILLAAAVATASASAATDSIPEKLQVISRLGIEFSPGYVPSTNSYLSGSNKDDHRINKSFAANIRYDFSFNPNSRQGVLYKGAYQGIGIGVRSFFANNLLGTPVTAFVYQGAPLVHFNDRLWLGYEWNFGAAFGWKKYDDMENGDNGAIGSSTTAYINVALLLHYRLSQRWRLSAGIDAGHFSNGNTAWPNAGVNAIGLRVGLTYTLSQPDEGEASPMASQWIAEADTPAWCLDVMAFGAWRRKIVTINDEPQLLKGKFGVAGVQIAPMRRFNRYFLAGASLDLQYDESSHLESYHIDGTYGDDIKFSRPPFFKQVSAGLSARAEFCMPIFSINAGLGYNFLGPSQGHRFYQVLALKTFLSRNLFLHVGYRLSEFKDPENLMLGIGYRFR